MELKQRVAMVVGERLRDLATDQGVVPFDTGFLRQAHFTTDALLPKGTTHEATLAVGRPYARHVFYGIRGIKPRNKKALAFKAPKGWRGKVGKNGKVVLMSVGPRAPRPWLLVAIRNMKSAGFKFVGEYIKQQAILELKGK